MDNFKELLSVLATIKGKFLLSSYDYPILTEFAQKNGWHQIKKVFHDRLKHVQIECNNALKVIQSRDMDTAFHYVDPPYPETDMGHYGGYTLDNFKELLSVLATIKGKFLLSSYDYPILAEFAQKNGWHQIKKVMPVS